MSTAAAIHSHLSPPTEETPERGVLTMFDVDLSEADYFVADGDHVIRSREFDVIAGGASFAEALDAFGAKLLDFAIYLGDLEHLAENEESMFHILAPRVMRITRAFERYEEEQKRRRLHLFGLSIGRLRSEEDRPEWHQSSRHGGSSVPSLA